MYIYLLDSVGQYSSILVKQNKNSMNFDLRFTNLYDSFTSITAKLHKSKQNRICSVFLVKTNTLSYCFVVVADGTVILGFFNNTKNL